MTTNCIICYQELPPFEQAHNHTTHETCRNCKYCGHEVATEQINRLIKEENARFGDSANTATRGTADLKIEIFHQPCRDKVLAEEYKKKPVIITQEQLDYLNRSHLFMQHVMHSSNDLSIESNQEIAERMVTPWFHELDLEEKFKALKNFEAVCARMSIALSRDKNAIQTRIQAREIEKYKEVQDIREGQVTRKEQNRMKSLTEIEKDNEKANPALKARRKAIEGFMKVGLSEQAATAMVDGANKPN
jgi:hypothetical protein